MRSSKAFTLVELLIVIVVIAILAAISIVAYNGIQERARVASVSSALTQATKKIKLWQVDNPDTAPASLSDADITTPPNVTFQYSRASNNQDYCITATQDKTSYYLNSTTQTTPTSGGCPGHGVGGVQAVTNLVVNPSVESSASFYAVSPGNGGGVASGNRISSGGLYGTSFYRAQWTTPPSSPGGSYIQNAGTGTNELTAGKTYFFSAAARSSWSATLKLTIVWWNSSNATISTSYSQNTTMTAGQWATLSTNATAPANAVRARYLIESIGTLPTANSTLDVDGLFIAEGSSSYGYADGSSQNWVWNGTPHSSTSTGPAL